jgi:hypothetical protein
MKPAFVPMSDPQAREREDADIRRMLTLPVLGFS